jgi:putative endonuclease
MKNRDVGILGEKIALDFLRQNGYRIIETNYRCSEGEIDIIARLEETLVFVEVRTRKSRRYGSPEESITPLKKKRLIAVADHYGQNHEGLPDLWRIEVLAIEMEQSGRVSRLELIENAVDGM